MIGWFSKAAVPILRNGAKKKLVRPEDVKTILVPRFSPHLGSAMCTTPLFRLIKELRPDIKIGVLCDEFNEQIHKYNPYVDERYVVPNPLHHFWKSVRAIRRLRPKFKNYEWILIDSANRRNVFLLPSFATGIGCVAGFQTAGTVPDVHVPGPPGNTSEISANLVLLNLFEAADIPVDAEPEIYFSDIEEQFVDELIARNQIPQTKEIVAIQTQSKDRKPNRWPADRFSRLADRLIGELEVSVVFTGSSLDRDAIENIRSMMKQSSCSVAGQINIVQLAALLKRCSLFITLDTGPMHVGRAVDVPMVILASAYQPSEIWLPLKNSKHVIIRKDRMPSTLSNQNHEKDFAWMEAITVEEVFSAACKQLAAKVQN